ncbi:TonB-dependent receptor plug domain-containing protein [Ferrimonas sediminicola]|nr:TonB-dependent receptor [Ferrimonas sediminicola]
MAFAEEEATKVKKEDEIERIEVTGSRISRMDAEGPAPVVVISADDFKDKGFNTAHDALKALSQNTGTVQGNEFGAQGGFTANADTINLRDLGPGYTLVLVNGRRIAENPTPYNGQSNFVNLASIPFAAIDRIEILTSGASAIYGSDAVAGVVNVILKKDVEETTVSAQLGTTKDGGGDTGRLQLVTGSVGDKHSITTALEYYKQDPIYGKDRDWLDSVDDGPAGVNYLTRGILLFDNVNGTYVDPGEQACIDSGSGYEYTSREGRGFYCGYDGTGEYSIQNERETMSAYLTGSYIINDNLELFFDGMFQDMESEIRGFRHFVSEDVLEWREDGSGNLADHPAFGAGYENYDYILKQRIFSFDELGEATTDFDEQVWAATVGIQGTFGETMAWKAYYNESRYDYETSRARLKEEKVYEYFIGTESIGFGLPDGQGSVGLYDPITDEIRNDLVGYQVIKSDSYSRTLAFVLTGEVMDLPAGPMAFAATAEMNRQGYDLKQDDRTLNKDGMGWYNLTGTVGGGDRDRYAIGAEVLIPVLDNLEFELAGRYDEYDDDTTDVGGRFTPSAKATYRPIEEVMVRASYGESFRAPDMHYVFAGDSGFYTSVNDWTQCQQDWDPADGDFTPIEANCDSESVQGTRSGSKTLEEEKGKNWGFGFVVEPMDNLSFTLDYYKIELRDIVSDESVQGLIDDEYDCNNGLNGRDPNSGFCQQVYSQISRAPAGEVNEGELLGVDISPINKSRLSQDGIDATLAYLYESEYGDFGLNMSYTHVLSYKFQSTDDDDFEDVRDEAWNDSPRSKVQATISYAYEDFFIAVTGFRTGSIPWDEQPAENYDEDGNLVKINRLDPYYVYNLTASYAFTDNLMARGTVINLFDEKPEQDPTQTSWPYYNVFAYPGAAVGTEFYAEVIYTF